MAINIGKSISKMFKSQYSVKCCLCFSVLDIVECCLCFIISSIVIKGTKTKLAIFCVY